MQLYLQIIAILPIALAGLSLGQQVENPISKQLRNGDLLIADFEEREIAKLRSWGWSFEGECFNRDFRQGTEQMRTRAGRFAGRWFLTSFSEKLSSTGKITSPESVSYTHLTLPTKA